MEIEVFNGPFKNVMPEFIKYKQSQGFKYGSTMIYECKRLDNTFKEYGVVKTEISKENADKYIKKREKESISTLKNRCYLLKEFSKYLLLNDYPNIYLFQEEIKQNKYNFIPYIYSDKEVASIYNAVDNLIKNKKGNQKYAYPIIFRLLFSTGMRISEILNLKYRDINTQTGIIRVMNSKNNTSRMIVVSNSMNECLKNYIKKVIFLDDSSLFYNKNHNKYAISQLEHFFHNKVLPTAKISYREDGKGPRIHDARHTFAIKTLELMYDKGRDYHTILPILSKYLGHSDVRHTEYYLRFTKNSYEKTINKFEKYATNIIPEVSNEEL